MNRNPVARRAGAIAARGFVLVMAAATVPSATAETTVATAAANAVPPESSEELVDAPGRERVAPCGACHSLDYIRMNSRFLDHAGWTAVVNKMISVYGAPIAKADVDAIAGYLTAYYGKPQ
jgi:sulfite dehydrogenase (cytochrome) subunit B